MFSKNVFSNTKFIRKSKSNNCDFRPYIISTMTTIRAVFICFAVLFIAFFVCNLYFWGMKHLERGDLAFKQSLQGELKSKDPMFISI